MYAYDKANNAASATISITTNNAILTDDTISPSVTISNPTQGQVVTGTITITAIATDNVGVTKVEFYVDGDRDVGRKGRSMEENGSADISLTEFDKEILKNLLESNGRVSSQSISKKLEIPVTAIYRRRMRLENEFLEIVYTLKLDKLGWRNANLLISTSKGKASSIGKELLTHNSITVVSRSIGEHTIDLHAEIMFRNNTELLNLIEWIKSQDGVKDVVWSEPVEVVGKNMARPLEILDQLSKS